MVKKLPLLLFGIVILIVFVVIILGAISRSVKDAHVSGFHLQPEHWSGTITIVEHTFFAPWVTLTIESGTKILFDKKPNILGMNWTQFADSFIKDHNDPTGHVGYNQSHFDLTAKIIAIGTKDKPIIFTSVQAKPEYADWDQLVLFGGSLFDYVEVSYAHNGVNINTEGVPFDMGKGVTIKNSKIHDSLWSCIDIFSTNNTIANNEVYHCWHQAIGFKKPGSNTVQDNYIHDAQLSINCENGANPTVNNNHFKAAPLDPGCGNIGNNQEEPGKHDVPGGTFEGTLIYPANE